QQGQVGKEVYLLEEGSVRVYRWETGTDGFLIDLQAPTLFGETALLDPERIRTASVKALSDVRMLTIQISSFLSVLLSFPSVKENLRQMIASRR
ncbi:MAG: cyclic nucleotide-binding domain-containing protein, partial [Acidobacteria bacterium]|nr:cyclic nucleotide-binding domain-containing protein [Acidobacteriota bacterium]